VLDDIVAWAPRAWFAKRHNGGAAKAKDRFFVTALKRLNLPGKPPHRDLPSAESKVDLIDCLVEGRNIAALAGLHEKSCDGGSRAPFS
jgi:hypothetical protein